MIVIDRAVTAEEYLDMGERLRTSIDETTKSTGLRALKQINNRFAAVWRDFLELKATEPNGWGPTHDRLLIQVESLEGRVRLLVDKVLPDRLGEGKRRSQMRGRSEVMLSNLDPRRVRRLATIRKNKRPAKAGDIANALKLEREVRGALREMQKQKFAVMCDGLKNAISTAEANNFEEESLVHEVTRQYTDLKERMEGLRPDVRELLREELTGINERLFQAVEAIGNGLAGMDGSEVDGKLAQWDTILADQTELAPLISLVKQLTPIVSRMDHLAELVDLLFHNKVFEETEVRDRLMTPFNTLRKKLIPVQEKLYDKIAQVVDEKYHIVAQMGDGNCLFRSLSQIANESPEFHKDVREKVADHMTDRRDRFDPLIRDVIQNVYQLMGDPRLAWIKSVEQYLKNIRRSTVYGDRPEVQAAADLLGAPVLVCIRGSGGKPGLQQVLFPEETKEGVEPAILRLAGHQHYEAYVEGPAPTPVYPSYYGRGGYGYPAHWQGVQQTYRPRRGRTNYYYDQYGHSQANVAAPAQPVEAAKTWGVGDYVCSAYKKIWSRNEEGEASAVEGEWEPMDAEPDVRAAPITQAVEIQEVALEEYLKT